MAEFLSGKRASVTVGSAVFAFDHWDSDIKTEVLSVNNFTSGGFNDNIDGFTGATITLSGPYELGAMPFTSGAVYEFQLGYKPGVTLAITARVGSIKPGVDAEGVAKVTVTAESKGGFTAAIS